MNLTLISHEYYFCRYLVKTGLSTTILISGLTDMRCQLSRSMTSLERYVSQLVYCCLIILLSN
jgi:hypothetical protein